MTERHRIGRHVALIGAALLLTAAAACSGTDARSTGGTGSRPLAVGDVVPQYIARTLSGDGVAIGGTGAEPVTLVNVWATWCTSCREEFADLESLQQHYAAKGLRVVAVSVDGGNGSKVARFVKDQHATFTVAHDPVGRIENAYQVVGVPSSFLVGHDGRLLWTHVGALPKDAAQAVAQALGS